MEIVNGMEVEGVTFADSSEGIYCPHFERYMAECKVCFRLKEQLGG
jgi:hypothetical protein